MQPVTEAKAPGRIITFYSYKGGTGRSMALANVAWILASNAKKVLVLDWDLEAPGLHRYFRPFLRDKELSSSKGVIDYVTDFAAEAITPLPTGEKFQANWYEEQANLLNYIIAINWKFPGGGLIDFIPAGQQGSTYTSRFTAFNWQSFYDRLGGGQFLEATKRRMRAEYDYILIDSRTGVSDTAGICTVQMPDTLVVCFTYNNQSIEGAAGVTESVYQQRLISRTSYEYRFQIFPVPMRADKFELDKLERRKKYARMKFDPFISIPKGKRRIYWGEVEVPYISFYAYEELLATFKDDPTDRTSMLASILEVTKWVTDNEVTQLTQAISPEDRQRVLLEFAETPATAQELTARPDASAETESPLDKQVRLAETVFLDLNEDEQRAARRLWTRLVRVPRFREADGNTRLRVREDDVPEEASAVIPEFAKAQLLVIDRESQTGAKTIEAADEEFLRSWTRLQDWVNEDRDFLLWRQGLQDDLTAWQVFGTRRRDLLKGRSLATAQNLSQTRAADLNDSELNFISRSREWKHQLFRYYLIVAVVLLVAIFPVYWLTNYVQKRRTATRILEQARALPDQPDSRQLRALLALEALRRSDSSDARSLLQQSISSFPRRRAQLTYDNNVVKVGLNNDGSQVTTVSGNPLNVGSVTRAKEDRIVQIRDIKGKQLASNKLPDVSDIVLSPDGQYLAEIEVDIVRQPSRERSEQYSLRIVDRSGRAVADLSPASDSSFFGLRFSPDSRFFAAVGGNGRALLLRIDDRRFVTLPHEGVFSLLFGKDNRTFATLHDDLHVHFWDLRAFPGPKMREPMMSIPLADFGVLADLSADNDLLAIVYFRTRFSVIRKDTGKTLFSNGHADAIIAARFTPDGNSLITVSQDSTVAVWDVSSGQQKKTITLDGKPIGIVLSPDGTYMLVISSTNTAQLFETKDFTEVGRLIHAGQVESAAFSQDGKYLATSSFDKSVQVWEVDTKISTEVTTEACLRLTRNLTIQEYQQYLPGEQYQRTCSELP